MEFISAEEFSKQPVEVQKVFLDWWKPSNGDIFYWNKDKYIDCVDDKKMIDIQDCINLKETNEITPLFTEGQLRQFIEDKTHKITIVEFDYDHYNIVQRLGKAYITKENVLIQAYWKVAIEIAKEGIK